MKKFILCLLTATLLVSVHSKVSRGGSRSSSPLRKTLKKAYGARQRKKANKKFLGWSHDGDWEFEDWNTWRLQDGMLCRTAQDCEWPEENLLCRSHQLDFSPSTAWFGGDFASIVGWCECKDGLGWTNYELVCEAASWSPVIISLFCLIPMVALGSICAVCFCVFRKM